MKRERRYIAGFCGLCYTPALYDELLLERPWREIGRKLWFTVNVLSHCFLGNVQLLLFRDVPCCKASRMTLTAIITNALVAIASRDGYKLDLR